MPADYISPIDRFIGKVELSLRRSVTMRLMPMMCRSPVADFRLSFADA